MSVAEVPEIDYPEDDGKPMSDNTLQWDWMVMIVGELRELFAGQEVFVAGNLLWYPIEGNNRIRSAPDAMVVLGRPPGHRGSYLQWKEAGIAPQVTFEVYSPSNTTQDLQDCIDFYETYGVQEYYWIDPYEPNVIGYRRRGRKLVPIRQMNGFVSPLLGISFHFQDGELVLRTPAGRKFQSREDRAAELAEEVLAQQEELRQEQERANEQQRQAEEFRKRAEKEKKRAEDEKKRAEALAAKLRELGINPDEVE